MRNNLTVEEMLAANPELANLTPEKHSQMQRAPLVAAGVGGLAGGGLGALFAKLTGKVNPLLGAAAGLGLGSLSGLGSGMLVKNAYNKATTPEEAQYLAMLDPSSQSIISPDKGDPLDRWVIH